LVQLGSVIFEVIEDEDDGFRSSMEEVRIITREAKKDIFLAEIVICSESDGTHSLRDINDDHIWLNFGTDNSDNYYPSFIFSWNPKKMPEYELINLIK